ncbi:MAG: class I SAM-dependent methyltransferase [Rhodobacteraceae bacterium]|nr:class I SAM-dependent methyltransferase [Paracoccaceae bacterium]
MPVLTSTSGEKNLPRYFTAAFRQLCKLKNGAIDLALPDGRVFRAQGQKPGPNARIDIHSPDIFARLAREGDLGFSDAYLEGAWSSPDLQAFFDAVLANNKEVNHGFPGAMIVMLFERFRHWMKSNSREQAKKNISYHYDLGNDFYSAWLDDTMTYSSAIFETGQESMEAAQTAKYASMCDEMGLKPGNHILEIGCGWGGFAEYAARERRARLTCLTISREQHDFAKARMERQGLGSQVEIVMRDYRDETGTYDGIASIEMFEAVGEKYWPAYFNAVRDRLKPGARGTFQIITIRNEIFPKYRKTVDFIQKHIFPGGMLPSPNALREEIEKAGLIYLKSKEFGESYSITLRRWYERFNDAWPKIQPMHKQFDERFKRMWDFYLTSCASAFHYDNCGVRQVTIQRSR